MFLDLNPSKHETVSLWISLSSLVFFQSRNYNFVNRVLYTSSIGREYCIPTNSCHVSSPQSAMLLPVLVHHVRYHACLNSLDKRLGYTFKDRSLLQVSGAQALRVACQIRDAKQTRTAAPTSGGKKTLFLCNPRILLTIIKPPSESAPERNEGR